MGGWGEQLVIVGRLVLDSILFMVILRRFRTTFLILHQILHLLLSTLLPIHILPHNIKRGRLVPHSAPNSISVRELYGIPHIFYSRSAIAISDGATISTGLRGGDGMARYWGW